MLVDDEQFGLKDKRLLCLRRLFFHLPLLFIFLCMHSWKILSCCLVSLQLQYHEAMRQYHNSPQYQAWLAAKERGESYHTTCVGSCEGGSSGQLLRRQWWFIILRPLASSADIFCLNRRSGGGACCLVALNFFRLEFLEQAGGFLVL